MNGKEQDTRGNIGQAAEHTYHRIEAAVVGTYQKTEDTVAGAYQKIEDTMVGAYQKVEQGAVNGYKKMEAKFTGSSPENADACGQQYRGEHPDVPGGGS